MLISFFCLAGSANVNLNMLEISNVHWIEGGVQCGVDICDRSMQCVDFALFYWLMWPGIAQYGHDKVKSAGGYDISN
jgi:hypothetical protein